MNFSLRVFFSLAAMSLSAAAHADFHARTGLQLYSLRATTLSKGFPATLDLAKGFGLTEVEGGGSTGGMSAEQIRAELDRRGLKMVSMHAGYEALTKDAAALIRDAKTLGATCVFCPWIPHKGPFDAAVVKQAVEDFNRWGAAFRAEGLTFGYHIHGYEFGPGAAAGTTLMEEMVLGTKPEFVAFEMDVFWVVHGGGDPVKLLQQFPKRWAALHVKDMRKGAATGLNTGSQPKEDEVVVGQGQVDWKAVISAAEKSGVMYYFIEDETADPITNIAASHAFLKELKL